MLQAARNKAGESLLLTAARSTSHAAVKLLIDAGLDVRMPAGDDGRYVLSYSYYHHCSYCGLVVLLLELLLLLVVVSCEY